MSTSGGLRPLENPGLCLNGDVDARRQAMMTSPTATLAARSRDGTQGLPCGESLVSGNRGEVPLVWIACVVCAENPVARLDAAGVSGLRTDSPQGVRRAHFLQQEQSGWCVRKHVPAVSASDAFRGVRLAGSALQSRSAPSATVAAGPGFALGEREVPSDRLADCCEPVALTSDGSDKTHAGTRSPRKQRATLYW